MKANKEETYLRRARNIYLVDVFKDIAYIAEKNGIKLIALKGISYLLTMYKDPAQRDLGDIDILVHPNDLIKFLSLLEAKSYYVEGPKFNPRELKSQYLNSLVLKKETKISYFLHLHWNLKNTSLPLKMFNFEMADLFSQSKLVEIDGLSFLTLSSEHEFLYMCFHAFVHSYDRPSLLEDMKLFLSTKGSNLDEEILLQEMLKCKLAPCVYVAISQLGRNFSDDFICRLKKEQSPELMNACDNFIKALDDNGSTQNLVMPVYLAMLPSFKNKFLFCLKMFFPSVMNMKRIYREHSFVKLFSKYLLRIKNAFLQFKTLLARYGDHEIFTRLSPYLKVHRTTFIYIVLLQSLAMLFALATPIAVKYTVDELLRDRASETFIYSSILASVLYIASVSVQSCANYFRRSLRIKLRNDISKTQFANSVDQNLISTFEQSPGTRVYELVQDSERTAEFMVSFIADFSHLLPKFVLLLVLLCYFDWLSAVLVFVFASLLLFVGKKLTKKMQSSYALILDKEEKLNSHLQEVFENIFLIKSSRSETFEKTRYKSINNDYYQATMKNVYLETWHGLYSSCAGRLSLIAILLLSLWRIKVANLSPGAFSAAFVYLLQLAFMQNTFILLKHKISLGKVAFSRLNLNIEKNDSRQFKLSDSAKLEISNLSFAYKDKTLFEDYSCEINPGLTAITGVSGVGKSTLLNIIAGLLIPDAGEIHYPLSSIEKLSLVAQEPLLWNDTVINNIAYGLGTVTVEEAIDAAKMADADRFIKNLADAYSTVIDPEGANLSIGQRQKISLARALLSKPEILLIDEAFSSWDEESEQAIIENLKNLPWLKYVIVVSHRRSTITKCDKQIVLS